MQRSDAWRSPLFEPASNEGEGHTCTAWTDVVCPRCRHPLDFDSHALACQNCRSRFPIRDEIPVFAGDPSYYFGELPRLRMRQLHQQTKEKGWNQAFADLLEELDPTKSRSVDYYISAEARAGLKHLISLSPEWVALDFGCGWGPISLSLAESVAKVYSLDLTFERLLLLRERA